MDRNGIDCATDDGYQTSLYVWATAMSRLAEDRTIGRRRSQGDCAASGPPLVCDEPAATYKRASDEHGGLAVSAATDRLGLYDKILLIPGHCDPIVNLYDWTEVGRGSR